MSDRQGGASESGGPWHWATAVAGLVLVLATIALLVRDGTERRRTPYPALSVTVDTVAPTAGGHVVRLRVRNDGGVAAANVTVRGELHDAADVVEEAETSLDYVPPKSERAAGLVFAGDPRALRLVVRATGFDLP